MRRFYRPVDKRSRKAMTAYLKNHFRYPTMNSWNRSTSYACNLKIYSLGLSPDITEKLYDLIQVDETYDPINDLMRDFGESHDYCWQVGMNGRSGGYLVLYKGRKEPSGYKSYCTRCGQKNYKAVAESGNICGRCQKPARKDYTQIHMRIVTFPGQGTDEDEDFEEWTLHEIRDRVALVQELDRLADSIVQEAVYIAKHYTIGEEVYMVEKKCKTLVENV